ncbi:protein phosphatase methylesterase 1 [Lasallia pustulata]|uniref:Protein phosphatase methylesterase 1 n=1 Tax=Lasallia pustulata TaxID=136370 RepID=A0A1W5D3U6_9LECA|nr:protein phosphatase methylesterase 1 [Lasallia pustulata]
MPQGLAEEEDEQDDLRPLPESHDDDSSSASSASSTGTIKPSPSKHLFARPKGSSATKRPLDEISWTEYFDQELYLDRITPSEKIVYHVYLTPPSQKAPLFVTHHGAGSSGLSFAVLAAAIRRALPGAGILSLDARGHGETVVHHTEVAASEGSLGSGNGPNLSLPILSEDMLNVINLTQKKMGWQELPGLILVGHSLGGAVVTEVAYRGELKKAVLGYAVLDVVEGSAIDALQSMQSYLSTRPMSFPSLSSGIEWHTRTRTIRNTTSARVSVPSLLYQALPSGEFYPSKAPSWSWRTDLAATQPFWEGWFVGLSKKFLEAKGGKLLLLAGTDRLDKELMIGQMQGRYQLQVFPEAGHFIQEDQPEKTAMVLADFYRRNDRSALVLPPKVGDILKNRQLH